MWNAMNSYMIWCCCSVCAKALAALCHSALYYHCKYPGSEKANSTFQIIGKIAWPHYLSQSLRSSGTLRPHYEDADQHST